MAKEEMKDIEKWKHLTIKEKIGYCTAIACFSLGWLLVIIGFFISPVGEVSSSVLYGFGMALGYTGSILGISLHYSAQFDNFKQQILSNQNTQNVNDE